MLVEDYSCHFPACLAHSFQVLLVSMVNDRGWLVYKADHMLSATNCLQA